VVRLIESDVFPFEFLSQLAERESWRKEIHRPIYHVHKWWAKRLGSVFRGILLSSVLPEGSDLAREFYKTHRQSGVTVFDPFMGSGTTIGEAHKLGFTAIGRDINPVAVEAVRTAFGPLDQRKLETAFEDLSQGVGAKVRDLYRATDSQDRPCDVLYHFWVMQAPCLDCQTPVDLFSSWIIASNAYPSRKPEVQILCPRCGAIFPGIHGDQSASCPTCRSNVDIRDGTARGAKATCRACHKTFTILDAVSLSGKRPTFRLYGKLVLTRKGDKEYLPATAEDQVGYRDCSAQLEEALRRREIVLPTLALENGYNTRQAMGYRFTSWRDFFNDRQLLALGWLRAAIAQVGDPACRSALSTLFSGVLEFNNMFASYKGEGTGAVRHMFSHHILKPERMPIEANVWGTPKSSGSFSGLFRNRLLRALEYRLLPTEVNGTGSAKGRVCSPAFTGILEDKWPTENLSGDRTIYVSCGDSAATGLPRESVDLVVTDPPFFDNVHYSELADFFHAWQQLAAHAVSCSDTTTRSAAEVQDSDADRFAAKLRVVLVECGRVLKAGGLLVFTYHHSRDEGWKALADAVLGAGFTIANSQPVKAEMSVATPKAQAKEPIQLDIILVCRKSDSADAPRPSVAVAVESAKAKIDRLRAAGFALSRNDRKIVLIGQLLTTIRSPADAFRIIAEVENGLDASLPEASAENGPHQVVLFE
jgi:putative DNA methylase